MIHKSLLATSANCQSESKIPASKCLSSFMDLNHMCCNRTLCSTCNIKKRNFSVRKKR